MQKLKELEQIARQLEPDKSTRASITQKTSNYVDNFIESLPKKPGFVDGECKNLCNFKISEQGKTLDEILNILENEVDTLGINSAAGTHLGYIPGGGLWTSAIADMLAATANRYAGIAFSSPGAVAIENQMIQWLCSVVGYPEAAHGNLCSGGSIANLIAVKTARDFHNINADNVKNSVIYVTEHTHHCIAKALDMTGLKEVTLRKIPMTVDFRMDVEVLQNRMQEDRGNGLKTFMVIATAGTTDTGAIDPLNAIADLCAEYGAWFHVDAAYGGFFMLVEELRHKFKGIERSDSVVLDPHKTLFIPYGSGIVLIKNREALLRSFSQQASYMKDAYKQPTINPSDTGPELSKHFRGLRMWLPLHLHGLKPFRANLHEKILLCQYFHEQIQKMGFETGPKPDLSVCIFRFPDANDKRNQQLIEALHRDGRVFLSSTTIAGKMWIRCAVVSFRTHMNEIALGLKMIDEAKGKLNRKPQTN